MPKVTDIKFQDDVVLVEVTYLDPVLISGHSISTCVFHMRKEDFLKSPFKKGDWFTLRFYLEKGEQMIGEKGKQNVK